MSAIIYPRGFLGFDVGVVQEKSTTKEFLQTVRGLEFNRAIPTKVNPFPPNPDVVRLWESYLNGAKHTTSFAFREEILLTAFKVIKTKSFYDWCMLQNQNPYFSSIHKKFLEDTLDFIRTGVRSMSVSTWISVVRVDTANTFKKESFDSYERVCCDPKSIGSVFPNDMCKTINVINKWTSNPSGFDDLLASLVVMFGSID